MVMKRKRVVNTTMRRVARRRYQPAKSFVRYPKSSFVTPKLSNYQRMVVPGRRRKRYPGKYRKYNKSKDQIEISQHNDLSMHSAGICRMPGGQYHKTLGEYKYRVITQFTDLSGQTGRQLLLNGIERIFSRSQIIGNTATSASAPDQFPDDLFLLNPNSTRGTNTLFPGPADPVSFNDYLYIKSVKFDTKVLSLTNVAQKVTAYWLTPNYDTDLTPQQSWTEIVNGKNLSQGPAGTRPTLLTLAAIGGADGPLAIGANPFEHIEFRKQWKVMFKQVFVLQPGDQRAISGTIVYNKAISRKTFLNVRKTEYLKGFTVFPFIIVEAGLVGISSTTGTRSAEVSTAVPFVGVFSDYLLRFGSLPESRNSTNRLVEHHIVNDTTDVTAFVNSVDQEQIQTLV